MKYLKSFYESKDLNKRIENYLDKKIPGDDSVEDKVKKLLKDEFSKNKNKRKKTKS